MKKALGVARALGVLLAIWVVLGLIGLVAGVIPPGDDRREAEARDVAQPTEDAGAARDAGPAEGEAEPEVEASRTPDAGPAEEPTAPREPGPARWLVCDAAVREPTLAALQIIGSPSPELAVGCDGVFHLLAVEAEAGGLRPVRVVTFDAETQQAGALTTHAGRPAAGDVDADSLPDLILPFWQATPDGSARGGRLFLVRRDASGAFAEPRLLGPIAAVDVRLGSLDERPGLDVAALNRGSELARRPAEAWVFSGGASPLRTAVLRGGLGGRAVALADLDRDDHVDVIALSKDDPRVDVFFGDGSGRFPRSATVTVNGGAELVAADVDGDGGTDVLVRGQGLHLLRAGDVETLEPQPIDAPADLREVIVSDVGDDGRRDIVGLSGGAVVVLTQGDDLSFQEGRLLAIEGVVAERLALGDLDGDGALDGAILARGGEGTAWELMVIGGITRPRDAAPAAQASHLPDAPLVLTVALQ